MRPLVTVLRWLTAGVVAAVTAVLALLTATHLADELPRWLPIATAATIGAALLLALVWKPARRPVLAVLRGNGRALRALWRTMTNHARTALFIALMAGSVLWFAYAVIPAWVTCLLVAAAVALASKPPSRKETEWWSHRSLVAHLITAGALPPAKPDQAPHILRYHGQPRRDDNGDTVVIGLPGGRSFSDVQRVHERLASSLGVAVSRLVLSQEPDDPAGLVRIFVSTAPAASSSSRAAVATAASTSWWQPVPIGHDQLGQPVELHTHEQNTIVGGIPGSGKTSLARLVLAHYLLDPTATVYVVDGKGSQADYGAARALCSGYVSGTDEDAADDTLALLDQVLALVRDRNRASVPGQHPGGCLVLLEEYQDVRAGADKPTRERLDNTLGRIVRMGRAVGVHVLVSTQRPSVDDVPSGVRNLLSQRVALMLRNGADAALILGTAPTLPLPSKRGQALLADPTGTRAVTLAHLSDTDWRAVCQRATQLRPVVEHDPATEDIDVTGYAGHQQPEPDTRPRLHLVVDHDQQPPPAPEHTPDPLDAAVLHVLATGDPAGLSATAILSALPNDLAPATPASLAKRLRAMTSVTYGRNGKSPAWKLAQPSQQPSDNPRAQAAQPSRARVANPRKASRTRSDEPAGRSAHAPDEAPRRHG